MQTVVIRQRVRDSIRVLRGLSTQREERQSQQLYRQSQQLGRTRIVGPDQVLVRPHLRKKANV